MENRMAATRESAEAAAAGWIARRECDGWGSSDEAELRAWIDADINHRVAWLRVDAAWKQTNRLKSLAVDAPPGAVPARQEMHLPFFEGSAPEQTAREEGRSPVVQASAIDRASVDSASPVPSSAGARGFRPEPPSHGRALSHRALAAGIVIATVAVAIGYLSSRDPSYQTQIGALQAVPLSDGSRVTLNTDTEIRVAVTPTERRVELEHGEAYFEVAKDPLRPFIVKAGKERIVAVGTQFSVRREKGDVRVVVTEGAVRVESGAPEGTLLRAGSVALAGTEGVLVQQKPVSEVEQALSWRAGYLMFDRTPLAEAVAEFNRYNTRHILIDDPAVATIPVGGNFRAANVDAFLRLIESELSVDSVQHGNQIVLRGRKQASP